MLVIILKSSRSVTQLRLNQGSLTIELNGADDLGVVRRRFCHIDYPADASSVSEIDCLTSDLEFRSTRGRKFSRKRFRRGKMETFGLRGCRQKT